MTESILSQFWGSEVQDQGYQQVLYLLEAVGEDTSLPPPASGGSGCPLACGPTTPIFAFAFTWPFPVSVCLLLF